MPQAPRIDQVTRRIRKRERPSIFYRELSTYVAVAVALVLLIDYLSAKLRARFRLQ